MKTLHVSDRKIIDGTPFPTYISQSFASVLFSQCKQGDTLKIHKNIFYINCAGVFDFRVILRQ